MPFDIQKFLNDVKFSDWIALGAVLVAVGSYWLGRRYTDKQFALSNYPGLRVSYSLEREIRTIVAATRILTAPILKARVVNLTEVAAVDLRATVIVTTKVSRVILTKQEPLQERLNGAQTVHFDITL